MRSPSYYFTTSSAVSRTKLYLPDKSLWITPKRNLRIQNPAVWAAVYAKCQELIVFVDVSVTYGHQHLVPATTRIGLGNISWHSMFKCVQFSWNCKRGHDKHKPQATKCTWSIIRQKSEHAQQTQHSERAEGCGDQVPWMDPGTSAQPHWRLENSACHVPTQEYRDGNLHRTPQYYKEGKTKVLQS